MELNIINLYSSIILSWVGYRVLDEELIIDSKLAFRHATQLSFNHHLPKDVRSEDSPSIGEQHIYVLNDVYEYFILLVFYSLSPPRYCASRLNRDLLQFLNILQI